ncbi:MAG: response regulator, partial [Proteobacteria bacterium]|nr:response regulator [Pseudomonadota bacterium]
VIERMFDPFFTTKGSGRGLGLSAVLGIVRSHGGGLKIWTEPAQGTVISVWLPLMRRGVPKVVEAAPAQPISAHGRILVVDDEPMLRDIASRLLRHLGFDVAHAASGAEAERMVATDPRGFRMVLLDETMPGMTGTETLAALRQLKPELPVLRTSGFMLDELHSDRHTDFLSKPYSLKALEQAIKGLLER